MARLFPSTPTNNGGSDENNNDKKKSNVNGSPRKRKRGRPSGKKDTNRGRPRGKKLTLSTYERRRRGTSLTSKKKPRVNNTAFLHRLTNHKMQELYGPKSVTYDTLRASACIYFAVSYGVTSIEEIEEKNGIASSIAKIVGWKDGTKGVQNILKTFIENPSINISYPNKRFNNLSTRKISSNSPSKKLRRDGEKIGMSDEDIAITISRARLKRGMSPKRAIISKKIVVKERKRDGGRKVKTPHRQTGNRDANSDWAKTRLFMVKHFKNML